jgi:hypothetical protein
MVDGGHGIGWAGYRLWNPVMVDGGHGIGWAGYRLWNPVMVDGGHGIGSAGYRLWNPIAVVPVRWLERVALALFATGSVITILQSAIATIFIGAVRNVLRNR